MCANINVGITRPLMFYTNARSLRLYNNYTPLRFCNTARPLWFCNNARPLKFCKRTSIHKAIHWPQKIRGTTLFD